MESAANEALVLLIQASPYAVWTFIINAFVLLLKTQFEKLYEKIKKFIALACLVAGSIYMARGEIELGVAIIGSTATWEVGSSVGKIMSGKKE